jgi:GNAT superfamily N-acetyltransferase
MADLLVRLYNLPEAQGPTRELAARDVVVRRAMPYEKTRVLAWVRERFGEGWADECDVAFGNRPRSCFVAVERGAILGFACHDATCRNFFGPMGVAVEARGRGIGGALLLACLQAMAAAGYAYAIIGGVADDSIYRKVAGAVEIAGSTPGIYRDRLSPTP